MVDLSYGTLDRIKSYHTLITGREDYHPDTKTEMIMGIMGNPARKPRAWFVYGPNPWLTRIIQARCPFEHKLKDIDIAADTETVPVQGLCRWVEDKIGATPAHGSSAFPINPPRKPFDPETHFEYQM